MAATAIIKTIVKILARHGRSQGVVKAQKLGFNRSQISRGLQKWAKSTHGKESFAARKAYRAGMTPRNKAPGRFRETVEDRRLRQARGPEDATELY